VAGVVWRQFHDAVSQGGRASRIPPPIGSRASSVLFRATNLEPIPTMRRRL
jgi:hypothetical protein